MAEQENMHHPSDVLETRDPGEGRNAVSMEKLESYLSLLEDCTKAVQADMPSCKFNTLQCGYLALKLEVVVRSARSYLCIGVCSSGYAAKWVEIFKLLLTLGKQIESFVRSCCKDEWIQAAMTLTNMSEYVSSLGFNMELCGIAISKVYAGETGSLKIDELDNMNKTEVEIVKLKASLDFEILSESVKKELDSLRSNNRELANYLCQKLAGEEPSATSEGGPTFWGKLCDWAKPAKQLGRGGSAVVEKATWLGISVAKKTFYGPEDPDFLKEVEIIRQLCHSNIMSMFCFAKNVRSCSIIMELMDEDLNALILRRCGNNNSPPFPILEAVSIMLQIGEGVNYLHNNGFVHRDLKSKNILVKSLKVESKMEHVAHAKVADFGISKASKRDLTFSNQTYNRGTSKWMPPEIINTLGIAKGPLGNDHEPNYPSKCDTYSFAMVCYEILSGYEPFGYEKETYPSSIKDKVIRGERPKLPPNCPCPPMLKVLMERCWRKEPKERPRFDFICLQLKYLKFLLMIGADEGAHLTAAKELEAAAIAARKEEEEREQEATAKRRAEAALVEAQQANDALSPLEKEARDVRARERESELEAVATNEALEQKAAAKSREKAALLVALRQGLLRVARPTPEQFVTAREKIQHQPNKFHVAVCGTAGSGKSSLINAFRGLRPRDACAARVGATETTSEVTRYPDPRSGLPYSRYVWYDIPGAGTAAVSDGQYFETQGLFAFDLIILVYGERFTKIDVDIIQNCICSDISIFIVRSKSDQHIENMIKDETDLSPGDDDYEQIYQEIKSKYIDATKSDFNMHKEVMAEVLFDGKPWLQEELLRQRVYMVFAANVRSILQTLDVQTGVKKGGGVNKSKIIDEALLVEDVLRAAVEPIFSFKVAMCCVKCEEKVVEFIEEVYGVHSVTVDRFRSEVIVVGNVDPIIVLKRLKRIHRKARIVEGGGKREKEEGGQNKSKGNDNSSNNANNNNRG